MFGFNYANLLIILIRFFFLAIIELFFLTASEMYRAWERKNVCLLLMNHRLFFFTGIYSHFISFWIISYSSSLFCFGLFFPRYKVNAFYNSPPLPWKAALKSSTHPQSFPNLFCALTTFCSSVRHIQSDAVIWPHLLSQRTRWCQRLPCMTKTKHTHGSYMYSTRSFLLD